MCNCKNLPPYIADTTYFDKHFQYEGFDKNKIYFQEIESESWYPEMEFDNPIIQCQECGQFWYFEYAPEEMVFPLFGLKIVRSVDAPNEQKVRDAKQQLLLLAHGGIFTERCRVKLCNNFKLKGRELCAKHIPFP